MSTLFASRIRGREAVLTHDFEEDNIGLGVAFDVRGHAGIFASLLPVHSLEDEAGARNDDTLTLVVEHHDILSTQMEKDEN